MSMSVRELCVQYTINPPSDTQINRQVPSKPIKLLPCRLFVPRINHTCDKCALCVVLFLFFLLQTSRTISQPQSSHSQHGNLYTDVPVTSTLNAKLKHTLKTSMDS